MTGPAIRYWEFANVLNQYFTVRLAVPPFVCAASTPQELNPQFEVILCQTASDLKALTYQADVIITVGTNLSAYPFLAETTKPLVVDMYIPFMLEGLQKYQDRSINEQIMLYDGHRGAHTRQIRSASFIICASEKQKDFWLGWLSASGRVNPYTYRDDPTLSKLIAVIPYGLPRQLPTHDAAVLKGVYKTIAADDRVILWGGGLWNWLDPHTLIKAMPIVAQHQPKAKLFFMGVKSPNPYSAQMTGPINAIALSQGLGLHDTHIFFNDWVPYHERQNYLLEADIGASLHLNNIETRFSFRTRLLDYIWTGLPILTTEGDIMSEVVVQWGLGKVVKTGDVNYVSQALLELLETPNLRQHYKANFDRVRAAYEWETVMAPLIEFCAAPYRAADKPYLKQISLVESGVSSWRLLPAKIWRTLKSYGIGGLTYRIKDYIKWKLHDKK